MVWEVWARLITVAVLGGPLEPAGLVTSLVQHWTGYQMPRLAAEAAHYVIGIVGYPVAYFVISRAFRYWAPALDAARVGDLHCLRRLFARCRERRRRSWASSGSS